LPGLRVLSRSRPPTPVSAKRRCQRHTVGRLTPTLGGCPIPKQARSGPRRVFLPPVAVGHDRLQLFPIQSADNHRYCLSHLASIAHSMWFMTLLNGSVH
jgi:hypothetical protein